jgi:hypothetical protein
MAGPGGMQATHSPKHSRRDGPARQYCLYFLSTQSPGQTAKAGYPAFGFRVLNVAAKPRVNAIESLKRVEIIVLYHYCPVCSHRDP